MVAVSDRFYMTPQEFLQWEASQEIKHEYLDGEVFAMTGGSIPHAAIALN
ncbi:MAG: Uma2 family endonuclease, partial [Sphaerospermopsis kisseleviana]